MSAGSSACPRAPALPLRAEAAFSGPRRRDCCRFLLCPAPACRGLPLRGSACLQGLRYNLYILILLVLFYYKDADFSFLKLTGREKAEKGEDSADV